MNAHLRTIRAHEVTRDHDVHPRVMDEKNGLAYLWTMTGFTVLNLGLKHQTVHVPMVCDLDSVLAGAEGDVVTYWRGRRGGGQMTLDVPPDSKGHVTILLDAGGPVTKDPMARLEVSGGAVRTGWKVKP